MANAVVYRLVDSDPSTQGRALLFVVCSVVETMFISERLFRFVRSWVPIAMAHSLSAVHFHEQH